MARPPVFRVLPCLRFYLDVKRLHVDTTTTLIVMEDEVDRLVAAWRRERPDLDVEPLEVLSRVSRLARHLDRARRLAFSEHSWSRGSSTC
jgi:hypothetical protein